MKVHIEYGWPEGYWHSKKLRQNLADDGYEVTSSMTDADVIIAHSAGCYMLQSGSKAKLILLIGLPNWPRPLIKCTLAKIKLEQKDSYFYQKTFWHLVYVIFQPMRLVGAYRSFRGKKLPSRKDTKVILIHNEQDTYMDGLASKDLAKQLNWKYEDVKGQHDDLWQHPSIYVDFINQIV